jgi:tetratricopeptide (TPR) repeat protein
MEERAYRGALDSNALALRLDPENVHARANLLAALNNWALAESTAGAFDRSAMILEAGLRLDPGRAMYRDNYVAVHQQWIGRLAGAGRYDEALGVLARAAARLPGEEFFSRAADEIRRHRPIASGGGLTPRGS